MKSFKQYFFSEARKFPHLNPKIPVNDEIINHFKSAKSIPGIQAVNSFTSFTNIDKLGINPKSRYNTPLGIYAYPNSYIYQQIGKEGPMRHLPFAGDSPFANIFSVKGNIIRLNYMQPQEANDYYKKIIDFYIDLIKVKKGSQEWKTEVDLIDDIINESSQRARQSRSVGGRFWYVTMKVSSLISSKTGKKPHIAWNMLFRGIGIDGFVDIGEGIIHPAEETQAVFFSKRVIAKNKRVDNKYSPDEVSWAKERGEKQLSKEKELLDQIRSLRTQEEQEAFVLDNPEAYKFLKNPNKSFERKFFGADPFKNLAYITRQSEEIQMSAIDYDPKNIRFIKNPSEKIQIYVAKSDPSALRFIEKPFEKAQITAVESDPSEIGFIDNPSEKVQMTAVENDPSVIRYIKNPSEKVQIAAVESEPSAIELIKNPSEKVQMTAVENDPSAIEYIQNPSEKVQIAAVENDDPYIIEHIKNPSEKVQIFVVKSDPSLIRFIDSPSEKAQLTAVKSDSYVIRYIKKPSEKVQILAIEDDPSLIANIENPSEKVQILAVKSDPYTIRYIKKPSEKVKELADKT